MLHTPNFKIEFSYKGEKYTASVYRPEILVNDVVEYHLMKRDPAIPEVPIPCVFFYHTGEKRFKASNSDNEELNAAVLNAIEKFCEENNESFEDD